MTNPSAALSSAIGILCDLRREELHRFLRRISSELAPYECEVVEFVNKLTCERTEIPGLTEFKQGMACLCRYVQNSKVDELSEGLLLMQSARDQLEAVIESLDYEDPPCDGSAGTGIRCSLPKPPGGLVAKDARPLPPTDD